MIRLRMVFWDAANIQNYDCLNLEARAKCIGPARNERNQRNESRSKHLRLNQIGEMSEMSSRSILAGTPVLVSRVNREIV